MAGQTLAQPCSTLAFEHSAHKHPACSLKPSVICWGHQLAPKVLSGVVDQRPQLILLWVCAAIITVLIFSPSPANVNLFQ